MALAPSPDVDPSTAESPKIEIQHPSAQEPTEDGSEVSKDASPADVSLPATPGTSTPAQTAQHPDSDRPSSPPLSSPSAPPSTQPTDVLLPPSSAPSPQSHTIPSTRHPSPALSTDSSSHHPPVPTKKFSSINVNKKFLEKVVTASATSAGVGGSGGKEGAVKDLKGGLITSVASPTLGLATKPTSATPNNPHPPPRLLTTKLVHPIPTPVVPSGPPPSSWGLKPTPSPVPASGTPVSTSVGGGPSGWRAGGNEGGSEGDKQRAGTGRPGVGTKPINGPDGPSWRVQDFPTTAESLEDGQRKQTNALLAKQKEAAHQQAILQELDSFRGSHLDPKAHHWDDLEDENDDFLDEVVQFGDGFDFKAPSSLPQLSTMTLSSSSSKQEPSPSNDQSSSKPQRFGGNDFDRSWPQKPSGGGNRSVGAGHPSAPISISKSSQLSMETDHRSYTSTSPQSHHGSYPPRPPASASLGRHEDSSLSGRMLFNERSNRFETSSTTNTARVERHPIPPIPTMASSPTSGSGLPPVQLLQKGRPSSHTTTSHQAAGSFSSRLDRAPPPHLGEASKPNAPHAEAPRRPSGDLSRPGFQSAHPPANPSSNPAATSVLGGRPLPPHLSQPRSAALASAPTPSSHLSSTGVRPSLSSARQLVEKGPLGVNRSIPASSENAAGLPENGPNAYVPSSKADRPENISVLQKGEMHSAAERARLRREAEEEERKAAAERARAKAKELEESYKAKAEKELVVSKAEDAPLTSTTKSSLLTSTAPLLARDVPSTEDKDIQVIDFSDMAGLADKASPSGSPAAGAPAKPKRPSASDFFNFPIEPSNSASIPAAPILPAASTVPDALPENVWRRPSATLKASFASAKAPVAGVSSTPSQPSHPVGLLSGESSPASTTTKPLDSPHSETHTFPRVPKNTTSRPSHREPDVASIDHAMLRFKGAMSKSQELPSLETERPQAAKSSSSSSTHLPRKPSFSSSPSLPPVPRNPSISSLFRLVEEAPFTRRERAPSPPPAKLIVRLSGRPTVPRLTMDPAQVERIDRPDLLRAVNTLSWDPPLYKVLNPKTLSRDEMLLVPSSTGPRKLPIRAPKVALPRKGAAPDEPEGDGSDVVEGEGASMPLQISDTLPALPSPPTLAVIPPTPARPLKAAANFQRLNESSWRRREPLSVVPKEQAKSEGVKEGEPPVVIDGKGRQTKEEKVVSNEPKLEEKMVEQVAHSSADELAKSRTDASPSNLLSTTKPLSEIPGVSDFAFSVGPASEEQLAPLVRFMVSSEIDDFRSEELGLNSTDPGKEDGPEFPSILRPSSSEPKLNNEKQPSHAPRFPSNTLSSTLSPPSAATSSAWSKTPGAPSKPTDQHVKDLWAQPSNRDRTGASPFSTGLQFVSTPNLAGSPRSEVNSAPFSNNNNNNNNNKSFSSPSQHNTGRSYFQSNSSGYVNGGSSVGFGHPYQSFPSPGHMHSIPSFIHPQISPTGNEQSSRPSAPSFSSNNSGSTNSPGLSFSPSMSPQFQPLPSNISNRPFGMGPGTPRNGVQQQMPPSYQHQQQPPSQHPQNQRPHQQQGLLSSSPSMSFLPSVAIPHQGGVWLPVTRPGSYAPSPGFAPSSPQHFSPHGMYNPLPVPSPSYPTAGLPPQPQYRNLSEFSTPLNPSFQGRQPPPHQALQQQQPSFHQPNPSFKSSSRGSSDLNRPSFDSGNKRSGSASHQLQPGGSASIHNQQPQFASLASPRGTNTADAPRNQFNQPNGNRRG